jgi:hypothetical protein
MLEPDADSHLSHSIPFTIWLSVELNTVLIVSSIPLIRPLFIRRHHQRLPPHHGRTSTFDSVMSSISKKPRANLSRIDSEEEIMPQPMVPLEEMGKGIKVTREVEVTYQSSDYAFVHAALVGLVQGEIANPSLAR